MNQNKDAELRGKNRRGCQRFWRTGGGDTSSLMVDGVFPANEHAPCGIRGAAGTCHGAGAGGFDGIAQRRVPDACSGVNFWTMGKSGSFSWLL